MYHAFLVSGEPFEPFETWFLTGRGIGQCVSIWQKAASGLGKVTLQRSQNEVSVSSRSDGAQPSKKTTFGFRRFGDE